MGRKSRSKARQPEPVVRVRLPDPLLKGEEDRWATAIPIFAQNVPGLAQLEPIKLRLKRFHNISPSRMSNDLVRISDSAFKELTHRLRSQRRNTPVQFVFQLTTRIHETNPFAILRAVPSAEVPGLVAILDAGSLPDQGTGSIPKQAQTHENTRVIVDVKGRRTDFDRHRGHGSLGVAG